MKKEEMQKMLDGYNEDVKRHMSVLSEDFQGKIDLVVEQLDSQNKRLDSHQYALDRNTQMIAKVAEDVSEIKGMLGEKADKSELVLLEGRVSVLEARA